jgi:hypothetical protein
MSLFQHLLLECGAAAIGGGIAAAKGSSGALRVKLYLLAVVLGIANSWLLYFFGGIYARHVLFNEKRRAKHKEEPTLLGVYIFMGIWMFISVILGSSIIKWFR